MAIAVVKAVDVQEQVDRYLELHEEMSAMKKEMEDLKKDIRNHMKEKKIDSIKGTHGKQVYLQDARATNSTSIYSDYNLEDIIPILGNDVKKVTEIRVNGEKLEGLAKLSTPEVKQKIAAAKIVRNGTPRFMVKK